MKRNLLLLALGSVLVVGGSARAQPPVVPEPIYHHTFEESADNWMPFGDTAKAALTRDVPDIKEGQSALRFDYQIAARQMNALGTGIPANTLATLQTISFWLRADHDAPMICTLNEADGGHYAAYFSVRKDTWQKVELVPADFTLLTGATDPVDDNGKLDLDKIESLALADFGQILVQDAGAGAIAKLLGVQPGPHSFYLDDFTFSGKPLPQVEAAPGGIDIDAFAHPQVEWLGFGDVALERVAGETPAQDGMKAQYQHAAGRIMALGKPVAMGLLTGRERLTFNVTSQKRVMLVVQVEEKSGGKYNTIVEIPGGDELTAVDVAFADFKPADDSKDDNARLDLDSVKQILLLDLSGVLGLESGPNTLRVGRVRAQSQ